MKKNKIKRNDIKFSRRITLKNKVNDETQIIEWQKQNKNSIDAFNLHIDRNGVFSGGIRSF